MARYFELISIDDLKAKVRAAGDEDGNFDFYTLYEKIKPDLKVEVDSENWSYGDGGAHNDDFETDEFLGYHTLDNGLTYLGLWAGGDWEWPVNFCVYWDGKKLRAYVPTDGNPWNTDTKYAYGNDDAADIKNARKRYPETFTDDEDDSYEACDVINTLKDDSDLMLADIRARILPRP